MSQNELTTNPYHKLLKHVLLFRIKESIKKNEEDEANNPFKSRPDETEDEFLAFENKQQEKTAI